MNAPIRTGLPPSNSQPPAASRSEAIRDAAEGLIRASGAAAASGARRAVAQVRARPVTTGLLALGALGGGALLMNTALRRIAIANAPLLWKAGKRTLDRVRQEAASEPAAATSTN